MSRPACPACDGAWPSADFRIGDLGSTIAYLHDDQFFSGWTVLVLKRHATELFDLSTEERRQLIDEVADVAQALAVEFDAVKMNYSLLGNLIPHIHWHVVPRLPNDPAPREPTWTVSHVPTPLGPAERQERIQRIRRRLGM